MPITQKNILILNNQGLDEPGGGVTITKALIEQFSANNTVVFLSEGSENTSYSEGNLHQIKISVESYTNRSFIWRFAPVLRSRAVTRALKGRLQEYDIIITLDCKYFPAVHTYSPGSLNLYLSLSAIPIVALRNVEGGLFEKTLTFLQYAFLERYAFHKATLSVVSSQTHLDEVKKYERIRAQPHIVYPFIKIKTKTRPSSALSPNERHQLKKELGIEGKQVILTVTRLTKLKNLEYLLELAEKIERNDIVFLIIGDGGHKTRLETLACDKHVQHKVMFYGYHEQPALFYQLADIYIHPSYYESFSCVIHEAMLSGLPVIFPKNTKRYVSAFEELVSEKDAFCLNFTDQQVVLQTLSALLQDPKLRRHIGENARKRAEYFEHHFLPYARQIEDLMRECSV